jgi:hypothetical protein
MSDKTLRPEGVFPALVTPFIKGGAISEEHARRWSQFNPAFEKSLKPLSFWEKLFSGPIFRSRGRSDYISWLGTEEAKEARQTMRTELQ